MPPDARFLEPWTARKLLLGRKLPDICNDFEQKGIKLDHLYTHLLVPLAWIGREKVFNKWQAGVNRAARLFNLTVGRNGDDETADDPWESGQTLEWATTSPPAVGGPGPIDPVTSATPLLDRKES